MLLCHLLRLNFGAQGPAINAISAVICTHPSTSFCPTVVCTGPIFGVVYLMVGDCDAFYVGKTKRPFFHRIRGLYHNFNDTKMHFFALEHVPPNERGGDNDKSLLQREARWISVLGALRPPGLNYIQVWMIGMTHA